MCAKCDVLNRKIDHYKLLLLTINQKTAADELNLLIARHEAAKRALHPEAKRDLHTEGQTRDRSSQSPFYSSKATPISPSFRHTPAFASDTEIYLKKSFSHLI